MQNLRFNKLNLVLNGNELSGQTFACKTFIAQKLNGKWDAQRKVWLVDVAEVEYWIGKQAIVVVDAPAAPVSTAARRPAVWQRNGELTEDN